VEQATGPAEGAAWVCWMRLLDRDKAVRKCVKHFVDCTELPLVQFADPLDRAIGLAGQRFFKGDPQNMITCCIIGTQGQRLLANF
jgi:hypothetical protein